MVNYWHNSDSARRGVTLIELLLVLFVLVVLGALAVQSLIGTLGSVRLGQSAEQIRTALTTAKLMAIDQSQPVVFRGKLGSGEYRIEPAATNVAANMTAGTATPVTEDPQESSESVAKTGQLEEGVVFRTVNCASADGMPLSDAAMMPSDGDWSAPVVFMPTGVSYNAEIVIALASEDQLHERKTLISLRGITCTATVKDMVEGEVVQ